MASAGEKSLAVGHIPGFQIDPSKSATIYPFQIQDAGNLSCTFSTFGKMYGFGASSLKFREQGCTLLGHILCAPLSFQPLPDAPPHHNFISPHSARSNHAAGFSASLGLHCRSPPLRV